MKAHSEEVRSKTLELLRQQRSQQEISNRVGIPIGTVEDWAAEWRKSGMLVGYKRAGMEFMQRAKQMSNGYYPCLRKRYRSMIWSDHVENRQFGFENILQAIHYYLKDRRPRPCAYCGRIPDYGKVWGLDRIDSSIGHVPGNLVPCCSSNHESPKLSCQLSKSKFTLLNWMERSMSRANGGIVPFRVVEQRLERIYTLAKDLGSFEPDKEVPNG